MFNRSRSLIAAMVGMFAGFGAEIAAAARAPHVGVGVGAPSRHRSRGAPGLGKRGYMLNGKRVFYRPAAKFLPNVAGMRWEFGRLVPRHMGNLPEKRKREKPTKVNWAGSVLRRESPTAAHLVSRKVARAARRAGVISARQQHRLAKASRREERAVFYGVDLAKDGTETTVRAQRRPDGVIEVLDVTTTPATATA